MKEKDKSNPSHLLSLFLTLCLNICLTGELLMSHLLKSSALRMGLFLATGVVMLSTSAHAQSLPAFVNKWKNHYCGSGQCVALGHEWARATGQDVPTHAYAYQFGYTNPTGWRWITNTPKGVPSPGDLVIWGCKPSAGLPYGHIAVFSSGNTNSFMSFDQNWPLSTPCHLQNHNYNYVIGWLHRK